MNACRICIVDINTKYHIISIASRIVQMFNSNFPLLFSNGFLRLFIFVVFVFSFIYFPLQICLLLLLLHSIHCYGIVHSSNFLLRFYRVVPLYSYSVSLTPISFVCVCQWTRKMEFQFIPFDVDCSFRARHICIDTSLWVLTLVLQYWSADSQGHTTVRAQNLQQYEHECTE